jgi:rod shape-determining protein MreC
MVLDQGGRDGLAPGSGIVSVGHAAGKVVDTTAHESLVLTLVHPKAQWSVRMGTQGAAGRLVARNGSVQMAEVRDIPRAQLVLPGDTVTTTGFDGVFPPDIPVGLVDDVEGNEADEFQTVVIALGAQYLSSRHVTWLQSARNARIDSLTTPPSPSAP